MRSSSERRGIAARVALVGCAAGLLASFVAPSRAHGQGVSSPTTTLTASDWRTYGHDAHHSFTGVSSLTPASATSLAPAWFFRTADAVTANPVVVGNTVYVGSWDGNFYAIDRATGALRWKYQLKEQPAINPSPGNTAPRDVTSDGGLVTSSAWFEPGQGTRPDLVIFGGGYTLYALVATGSRAGTLYWSHDYTGLPEQPPAPTTDTTRIFSSPVVHQGQVIVGVSPDGESGHRGYVVSASLSTGNPIWRFETDVDNTGKILDNGCAGVWASPTLDESRGLVSFGVSDCNDQGIPPYAERVVALHATTGKVAWVFTPPRLQGVAAGQDPPCDFDFGATPNLGSDPSTGKLDFLGIGGKDGTYYRLDPGTGRMVWQNNVVFGGLSGGFVGTTAYDGHQAYGATGIGDFGSASTCTHDSRDIPVQEPSMHAFSSNGSTAWQQQGAQNLGATTTAGGMTLAGYVFGPVIQIRSAASGALLNALELPSNCFCAIAASGNAVFFGTGSPEQGIGDGVYAYTPLGTAPARS